jgi:uncharacterized membrane protein
VRAKALLWPAMAAFAVAFAALSIGRNRAFNTGRFDLGNMTQAIWNTAHGHFLEVTNLPGNQTSRLGSHFDPILAALAPLWLAWPSPDMLMVVQALAVALGALPVYWLARKHLGSERAGVGFALAYLLYPATQWLTLNEFHPVAFATPLLLFAFWYLDEDRLVPFALFSLIAIACKEEIGLVVAGFGAWYLLSRRRRREGLAILVVGIAATVVAVEVIVPHFSGSTSSFYSRYSEVGGSPSGIVKTLFTQPGKVLGNAFSRAHLDYLGHMLLPLGLLVVFSPWLLLAALPEAALNVLSKNPYQGSVYFHYQAGLIPPLMVAAVLGAAALARRRPDVKRWLGPGIVVLALLSNFWLGAMPVWESVPYGNTFGKNKTKITDHDEITAKAVSLIPAGAAVSATNTLGAHLSARRRIFSFPRLADASWVAADETNGSYNDGSAPLPMENDVMVLRRNPAWRLVFEEDGVLVFRRINAPLPAALRTAARHRREAAAQPAAGARETTARS